MPLFQFSLTICTVLILSIGQVLFKSAAADISEGDFSNLLLLMKPKLIIALTIYAIATVLWVAVLRITPLNQAYPFVAIAFFIVPLLSWVFLDEPLKLKTFIGAAVILLGVYISVN